MKNKLHFAHKTVRTIAYYYFLVSMSIVIFFQCAHQVPPQGGPSDLQSPYLVSTNPEQSSLKVEVHSTLSFTFSEWIHVRSAMQSVSIFPTLPDGISIQVSGNTMHIKPNHSFADSTTYHITISTHLTDLHSNKLKSPYTYIFSTHEKLDNGQLSGCIIVEKKNSMQPKVCIFRSIDSSAHHAMDSILWQLPNYLCQADSTYQFQYSHIRPGLYRCIAFDDNDNSNTLSPGKEQVYIPESRFIFCDSTQQSIKLYAAVSDTITPTISQCKALSSTLLLCQWNRIPRSFIFDITHWQLFTRQKTSSNPQIESYLPVFNDNRFYLKLKNNLTLTNYSITYQLKPVYRSHAQELLFDTVNFNGTLTPDTTESQLLQITPLRDVALSQAIALTWSKPVKSQARYVLATNGTGDSIQLTIDSTLSSTTVLIPNTHFKPDAQYKLVLPVTEWSDVLGNPIWCEIKDSLIKTQRTRLRSQSTIEISLQTIKSKNLCVSLSGCATCGDHPPTKTWRYTLLTTQFSQSTRDSGGCFRFDSLPSGQGIFSYFYDNNSDGSYTQGTLFPFKAPEPYFYFRDTVEARQRWDVSGIQLDECTPCDSKKNPGTPQSD